MSPLEVVSAAGKVLDVLVHLIPFLPEAQRADVQETLDTLRSKLTPDEAAKQSAIADELERAKFGG